MTQITSLYNNCSRNKWQLSLELLPKARDCAEDIMWKVNTWMNKRQSLTLADLWRRLNFQMVSSSPLCIYTNGEPISQRASIQDQPFIFIGNSPYLTQESLGFLYFGQKPQHFLWKILIEVFKVYYFSFIKHTKKWKPEVNSKKILEIWVPIIQYLDCFFPCIFLSIHV